MIFVKNVMHMSFVFIVNKANIKVHEEFSIVGGSVVASTMMDGKVVPFGCCMWRSIWRG